MEGGDYDDEIQNDAVEEEERPKKPFIESAAALKSACESA